MIFTLSILINLCLIVAVYLIHRDFDDRSFLDNEFKEHLRKWVKEQKPPRVDYSKINGKLEQVYRKASIAEKMGERAFNMASSANLGVIALQKSLVVPRLLTKKQGTQNALAKKGVDDLFSTSDSFDYLMPILSDEQIELIEKAQEFKRKEMEKQN